jgi:hypothetical protein
MDTEQKNLVLLRRNIFSYCIMDQTLNEVVGCCKRLIWDVKDLRYDVRYNDKPSHLVEKMRMLDNFQRSIALHGLTKNDPFYELCLRGSKGKKDAFKRYLKNKELNDKLENVRLNMIKTFELKYTDSCITYIIAVVKAFNRLAVLINSNNSKSNSSTLNAGAFAATAKEIEDIANKVTNANDAEIKNKMRSVSTSLKSVFAPTATTTTTASTTLERLATIKTDFNDILKNQLLINLINMDVTTLICNAPIKYKYNRDFVPLMLNSDVALITDIARAIESSKLMDEPKPSVSTSNRRRR